MKGLEISELYYTQYGRPMLLERFGGLMQYVCAGLVGPGSECFGFDDDVSRDHDFDPGFCLFIPGDDVIDAATEWKLERAYAELPSEFMGLRKNRIVSGGAGRRGVIRTADFYRSKIGGKGFFDSVYNWFSVSDNYLAEAVNGKVFEDNYGEFTAVRNKLLDMPADVRLKKLAGRLYLAGQAAPYNFERAVKRGDEGAAQLALFEFFDQISAAVFLFNKKYRPFYKWTMRAMRELPELSEIEKDLVFLLSTSGYDHYLEKLNTIDRVFRTVSEFAVSHGYARRASGDVADLAFAINDLIKDHSLRNENILFGV